MIHYRPWDFNRFVGLTKKWSISKSLIYHAPHSLSPYPNDNHPKISRLRASVYKPHTSQVVKTLCQALFL